MNKKRIIVVLIVLIALSILPPLVLGKKINEGIVTAATILGAFTSIITLVIALILYKKFGIDETVFSKRTETVFHLLRILQNKMLIIKSQEGKLILPLSNLNRGRFDGFKNVNLLFSEEYFDFMSEIFNMSGDYYLPKTIADMIKAREPSVFVYPNDIVVEEYGRVGFNAIGDDVKWGLIDGKSISLKEFVFQWVELLEFIRKWIKDHTDDPHNINI